MNLRWMTSIAFAFSLTALAQDATLQNPGFETAAPDDATRAANWGVFTETQQAPAIFLTPEDSKEGTKALRISFDGTKDGFMGLVQEIPATPGEKIKFSGFLKRLDLKPGTYLKFGIEWKRADGTEISRDQGEELNAQNIPNTDWKQAEVVGTAPSNTAKAVVTVTLYTQQAPSGAVLLDAMKLEKMK